MVSEAHLLSLRAVVEVEHELAVAQRVAVRDIATATAFLGSLTMLPAADRV